MIFGKMDWPWYALWFARAFGVVIELAEAVDKTRRRVLRHWSRHRRRIARSRAQRRKARREARQ